MTLTLTIALVGIGACFTVAQSTDDVVVSDATPTDFTVPEGDPAQLIEFIERLANPQQQFTSDEELQQYLDNVSTAIGAAADKILSAKATDQQTIDAIEWKIESLRIRERLGDDTAGKATEEFLANLKFESQPAVEEAIEQIRQNRKTMALQMKLMTKLRQWQRLNADERAETANWLIEAIKSGPVSASHASMLTMFCDTLSDTPNAALAQGALDELLPLLRASDDPGVAQRLPLLEGIDRRLHLPGNKLELAGTFLDGSELDWESYRGKVVLVDYWATWCGPCRAEVPNVLANYQKYRDKGFEVVGVCLDEKRGDAEDYLAQSNIPWPSLFHEASDESGWQHPMAVKYGITGIPTAILVDQQGHVVDMQARGERLGAALQQLLGEPGGEETSAVEVSDDVPRTAQNVAR
jgi:thiol-disulfide isomerase/thioredoxin